MGALRGEIGIQGRILFLCEDAALLARQLAGEDLADIPQPLCDNVSTDEITPAWTCFFYDETLGRYCLVGLRNGAVAPDAVRGGGFAVVVSGRSKGCGSSRETAPYAEQAAGIRLVIAASLEKIYAQNCQNIGVYTSTDYGLIPRLRRGEAIPLAELTRGLDPLSREVVERGGLFAYNRERLAGETAPPAITTPPRPMTLAEKIIARHAVVDAKEERVGVPAVRAGDALFCRTDLRFSHEYVTPMAASLFESALEDKAHVQEPESVVAFRDHLTFLGQVMSEERRREGLLRRAEALATTQQEFCRRQGIRLYAETSAGGSEAICHTGVLEDLALPGQLVCGTDSHTCTAGAVGCLAFGVGSTDMANAWYTRDVRISVPRSVRIELCGAMPKSVCAKDLMLFILADPYFREGRAIGQVLEFCGTGLATMPIEERATLTNMAVEAGGTTGIIAADEVTLDYLASRRRETREELRRRVAHSDPEAEYAHRLRIDLTTMQPMVATPGDPKNGVPLAALAERTPIDIAYGGSCTGGKSTDMDLYARVLQAAAKRGQRVHPKVELYIQFSSQRVKEYARQHGYIELFEQAGARLIEPSCGACINAGPGVSTRQSQVTVSAINRNFPGRSGPGRVYLASPLVVAASAVAGVLASPTELESI